MKKMVDICIVLYMILFLCYVGNVYYSEFLDYDDSSVLLYEDGDLMEVGYLLDNNYIVDNPVMRDGIYKFIFILIISIINILYFGIKVIKW